MKLPLSFPPSLPLQFPLQGPLLDDIPIIPFPSATYSFWTGDFAVDADDTELPMTFAVRDQFDDPMDGVVPDVVVSTRHIDATLSTLVSDVESIADDGIEAAIFTLQLFDTDEDARAGVPVPGETDSPLALTGTSGLTITWLDSETDAAGQAQFSAVSTVPRAYSIGVTFGGTPCVVPLEFEVTSEVILPESFTPNLPAWASGNLITDTDFAPPDGQILAEGFFNDDGLATTTDSINTLGIVNSDEMGPYSDYSYRTFYEEGDDGSGDGGTSLYGPEGRTYRRIYFSIAVKLDSNYRMNATGGEKFWYPRVTTGGSLTSSSILGWHLQGSQTPTGSTWCFFFDNQLEDGRVYQDENGVYPVKGAWNIIEVEMEMNTPGNLDGICRVWVNGEQAVNWTNIRYSAQLSQSVFDGIFLNSVRGGPTDTGVVPVGGQSRYYNRLAFYASNSGS